MNRVTRLFAALVATLFAIVGLECWIVPDQAAHRFGLEALRAAGLVSVRADLGGLFIGLAALAAAGAWARKRAALAAAATVLGAVIVGRVVGWAAAGAPGATPVELASELLILAGLLAAARVERGAARPAVAAAGSSRSPAAAPARHPARGAVSPRVVVGLAALLVTVTAGALLTPSVQQSLFDRAALDLSARSNTAPLADDALRVAVAGSSAPLPSASRAKASVVVFAGGKFWVVDSGPESTENLLLWGIPMSEIGGVLLTHFHSDHIGDLGELQLQTWAGGRPTPLDVYGGPGVEGVVAGFNAAYALDQGYRTEHHGESVMPSSAWGMVAHTVELDGAPTPAKDRTALVYDDGALRITAIEVDHAPIEPSYAYRFDYRGRSVVVTGDLKYHRPLIAGARNADILVSEAISRTMTSSLEAAAHSVGRSKTEAIMHDVQDYHISPEEAAGLANEAGVGLLVYYHLLPAPDGFLTRRLFASGVNAVRKGDWTIAEDGSLYTLPLGSKEVRTGRM